MKTIALLSWWKDSAFSVIEAKKTWIKIDLWICFLNPGKSIMLDWWPQTWWKITQAYFDSLDFPTKSILLQPSSSTKEAYDSMAKEIKKLLSWETVLLIHWELRYEQHLWLEMQKRIKNLQYFSAYQNYKDPQKYLDWYFASWLKSIISWTRFKKIVTYLWREYNQSTVNKLLTLWLSIEEILWEDDELQTLVVTTDDDIKSPDTIKEVRSPLNDYTYRII